MSQPVFNNTPIEAHLLNGVPILVKREDLCSPGPGPSFSKVRGVMAHIQNRPERVIGVLDTFHSKAGQAVAYICKHLGKKCINFWPYFKADNWVPGEPIPREQQRRSKELGAELQGLQAGRSAILFHQARRLLAENYKDSYMMPNALKVPEAVGENAAEVIRSGRYLPESGTMVISISSGTVAAGVIRGLHGIDRLQNYCVVLHMGYSRHPEAVLSYVTTMANVGSLRSVVQLVDEGYSYKDEAPKDGAMFDPCPFPCNSHYDLKAWRWLQQRSNLDKLTGPIVFWNIGD
jgi:hypothetical protein